MNETKKLIETIINGIQEKKGRDIVVADMSEIDGAVTKYMIICEGGSPSQVEAISGEVAEQCRKELREKPAHCVGLEQATWVAMDFVDAMVHVFVPEAREFYDLEHLWEDAKLQTIPNLD